MASDDLLPLQDPFQSLEIGPFYCSYEDDRWDGPELIVDPLSGFVVAIVPPRCRAPTQVPNARQPRILRRALRDLTKVIEIAPAFDKVAA